MIHLFHGTNVVFDAVDPVKGRRGTDTGLYREGPVYLYDMLCEERGFPKK